MVYLIFSFLLNFLFFVDVFSGGSNIKNNTITVEYYDDESPIRAHFANDFFMQKRRWWVGC